jgi:hypothetical protein
MTHTQQHIIIHKIRAFIASWPLSSMGGSAGLSFVLGLLF